LILKAQPNVVKHEILSRTGRPMKDRNTIGKTLLKDKIVIKYTHTHKHKNYHT